MPAENKPDMQKKPQRMFLFLPLKRVVPYVGIIVGILMIIFQHSLWSYTEGIVGRILIDIIRFETRGQYTISYEKVRFNILRDQLRLTNFSVIEKDEEQKVEEEEEQKFALSSALLSLNVRSFLDVLINRELQIEGLELIKPSLTVVDKRSVKGDAGEIETSKIFSLAVKYLKDFKIKELKVKNAKVTYSKELPDSTFSVELSDISLELSQFEILNPMSENEVISSSHFAFEILNDSIDLVPGHLITFDRIRGTSRDSLMKIENLNVIPAEAYQQDLNLSMELPLVELSGFDPRDLIFNDTLRINNFFLNNGKVNIDIPFTERMGNEKEISFPTVMLNGITTEKLDLNISIPLNGDPHQIDVNEMDINTSGLILNKSSFRNIENIIHDLDLNLAASKFLINLTSFDHFITLQNVTLNTGMGHFSSDNVELSPYLTANSKYNLQAVNFQIRDLNIPEILNNNYLFTSKILIDQADLRIDTSEPPTTREGKRLNPEKTIKRVVEIFPSVAISDLQILDSNLSFYNAYDSTDYMLENFTFKLTDIQIDTLENDDPADMVKMQDFSFDGNGIKLKLKSGTKEINSGEFHLSTFSGRMDVQDLHFTSQYPTYKKIGFDGIHASGLNWAGIIESKDLIMDSLKLESPKLEIDKLDSVYLPSDSLIYTSAPAFIDSLHVNNMTIQNGELDIRDFNNVRIRVHEIRSHINNIRMLKRANDIYWLSHHFYAENGPFTIALNHQNHLISGKGLTISKSDSTLRINQLNISPIEKLKEIHKANIRIPNLLVTGIDITHLLDSNLVVTDQTYIINPEARIDLVSSDFFPDENNTGTSETNESSLRFFSERISVVNASFEASYYDSANVKKKLMSDWVDLSLQGLKITPDIKVNSELLFIDEIEFAAQELSHPGLAMIDTLQISSLRFNSESYLKANEISISGANQQIAFRASIPNLDLQDSQWLKKILNKDYSFDSLGLSNPDLKFEIKETKESNNSENPALTILNFKIDSGRLNLTYGNVDYSIPEFDLQMEEFDLNGEMSALFSKNLSLNMKGLEDLMPESNTTLNVSEVDFSSENRTLDLKGLEMIPKYDKLEYGKEIGFQTDWINLEAGWVSLTGIDYPQIIKNNRFFIRECLVDSLDIHVFRDKNVPALNEEKHMPHKMIADIKFPVTVEAIITNNSRIVYEELNIEASNPGYVEFTNLTAGVSNFTNDSARLAKNSKMLIAANADFMRSGNLQADFEFDLRDRNGKHEYSAFLSGMPLTKLNKILEPNVNIQVNSGVLNEMTMRVDGNSDYTIGTMRFLYEDLHFNLISKKTGSTSSMGPSLGSFFANTFIINRDNPKLLFVRNGDIYYERDTTKSIFNYLAKSTLSGVVSSIGARNNRKYIRKVNKEAKEQLELRKKRERIDRDDTITSDNN